MANVNVSQQGYPEGAQSMTGLFVRERIRNAFTKPQTATLARRPLSLAAQVTANGGIEEWNKHPKLKQLKKIMEEGACQATTVAEALAEVESFMSLGHNIWAYFYLRALYNRNSDIYYGLLLQAPAQMLPVAYTPTVGEACQKFGTMPAYPRGCYVNIDQRGKVKAVLEEYASAMLQKGPDGRYMCQCIVFSDGGRILGLGDLGAWGMGIPIGKLDLYTVCGGFDPSKTIPVIIDAGCGDASTNSANLTIRDHALYTGLKKDRVTHKSSVGTVVNSCYYGADSLIREFMTAATDLFGKQCLLQFEDFNSNDAFPLLEEYRTQFLTYNDDIQGTASVAVAALLGGIKIQKPQCTNLIQELSSCRFLFHGAGSANLGGAALLTNEAGVPRSQVFCTNSKGLIWASQDGTQGTFRNDEQKGVAQIGKPDWNSADLISIIQHTKPDVLIGAVGRAPKCFTKEVVEAMLAVQAAKPNGGMRPIIFALSNPRTQAEITAHDCYEFSGGKAIFGSGTRFESEMVNGKRREPGQVNNFFIFPGMSFGAMSCQASTIPERLFMVAAEAVANSLDKKDIEVESVVPNPERIRETNTAVATAVVVEAQKMGLAGKTLGKDAAEVRAALVRSMWTPKDMPKQADKPKILADADFGPLDAARRASIDSLAAGA